MLPFDRASRLRLLDRMRPAIRASRRLRPALRVVLAAAVVYEIAINAFLMTGALGRTLSDDSATLQVDYASGWSVLPGRVHAASLRIRSRDSHVEFQLKIGRCVFRVALLELLRRRFHVLWLDGEDVTFRARRRIGTADATPRTVQALPPIDDYEAVPLNGPESPPPDDAHYHLWTVELDRVDARRTREIWVDQVRFEGDAWVRGGFFLRPIRWAAIGPAVADIQAGRLTTADATIASALTGSLSAAIEGFDPRTTIGADLFRHLSVRASLQAELPGAAFVNRWIDAPAPNLRGGAGSARLDLALDHGRIVAPGHLEVDARRLGVDMALAGVEGDAHASADVRSDAGVDHLDASLEGRDLQLFSRAFKGASPRAPHATMHLWSAKLDLGSHSFADAAVALSLPTLDIPDAGFVNAFLSRDRPRDGELRVEDGRGTAGGRLDVVDGIAHGGGVVGLDGIRITAGGAVVSGTIRARAVIRAWNLAGGTIDLGGSSIDVRDVRTSGGSDAWWASAQLPSSVLTIRPTLQWRARVQLKARDARPLLKLAIAQSPLPDWVAGLFSTDGLRAQTDVRAGPTVLDLHDVALTAGPFRVNGSFTKRSDTTHALALVEDGVLSVGIEKTGDDTHIQLLAARDWFHERALAEH